MKFKIGDKILDELGMIYLVNDISDGEYRLEHPDNTFFWLSVEYVDSQFDKVESKITTVNPVVKATYRIVIKDVVIKDLDYNDLCKLHTELEKIV